MKETATIGVCYNASPMIQDETVPRRSVVVSLSVLTILARAKLEPNYLPFAYVSNNHHHQLSP